MDVRKKLVELLAGCPCESDCEGMVGSCPHRKNGNCNEIFKLSYCAVSKLAQHLIANGVTVQEWDGCEYCNGLPFSQMEDFTMPNAFKKDYDIVTICFCPMCGRRLPQPPKG